MPAYAFSPLFCARTAAAIHCPPDSCVDVSVIWENWSLPNDDPLQISPVSPPLEVPTATCDEITSAPPLIPVQFDPRPPSARLKSSEALDVVELAVQLTVTLVMLAEAMVPELLETVQLSPAGLVFTVTL